jgi:hypothetical protein
MWCCAGGPSHHLLKALYSAGGPMRPTNATALFHAQPPSGSMCTLDGRTRRGSRAWGGRGGGYPVSWENRQQWITSEHARLASRKSNVM